MCIRDRSEDAEGSFTASWTQFRVAAGEGFVEILPRPSRRRPAFRVCRGVEQDSSSGDQLRAAPVCEQATVANADKRPWEDVDEKAPYEIRRLQGEYATPIAAATVAIAESDPAVLKADDATVRDRDPMRVPAEISEYLLRTSHGLSLIHISEPTRLLSISYAVF